MLRPALLASCGMLALLAAAPALAADVPAAPPVFVAPVSRLPAVSTVNGKVGAFGGPVDGINGWGVFGSVSVPLHNQWGLQVDGLGGSAGSGFWGVAGHLFWRDPGQGLLGLYASTVDFAAPGATVRKVGVEGELYLGRLSLEGTITAQTGDFTGTTGSATLAYYLHDNLRLDATYRDLVGMGTIQAVGAEWQFHPGLAAFADGAWGQAGYRTVLSGIKVYFGPDKSLIRRQREDDPESTLPFDLFNCGREEVASHSFDGVCSNNPF